MWMSVARASTARAIRRSTYRIVGASLASSVSRSASMVPSSPEGISGSASARSAASERSRAVSMSRSVAMAKRARAPKTMRTSCSRSGACGSAATITATPSGASSSISAKAWARM